MKRLLVCTIMRNQLGNLDWWATQLYDLIQEVSFDYDVEVSVYENDSTDGTADKVRPLLEHLGVKSYFLSETLGTQQYGSVWSYDRLRNLAAARQMCLDQVGDSLKIFDKIAFIEPDVTYDPSWCKELILARHPLSAGLGEPDIYSGWSLRSEKHPKESVFLYDTCATRATEVDTCWDVNENHGEWRAHSLVPTNLGGVDSNCLHKVWSTFNCFCVYNAKPFIEGLTWDCVNRRLNTRQELIMEGWNRGGYLDADTAVVCEDFRKRGYHKVYLNTNCLVRHN